MKSKTPRLIALGLLISGASIAAYLMLQCKKAVEDLPVLTSAMQPKFEASHESDSGHGGGSAEVASGHGAPASGHGGGEVAKSGAGGGGHGAPPADAHGAPAPDGHGAPASDAHGAPASDAHGAPPAAAHGAAAGAARSPAGKPGGVPLFSIDELYVNVASDHRAHTLGLKLELEMFEESSRPLLDSRQAPMRSQIIEVARDQEYTKLNSLAGKLYFKELLVSTLNTYFGQPLIKNIHFSVFYMQ